MTRQTTAPIEHHSLSATARSPLFFTMGVDDGDLVLDPPYQRGDVWTIDQRIGLIRSFCMGVPIPAVIINNRASFTWERANPGYRDALGPAFAVIDGKQRVTTLVMWMNGDFAVPASWFPAEYIDSTEDTEDGPYVRYTGLTKIGQRRFENRCMLPVAESTLATVQDEAQIYQLVNGAGTPQTGDDMAKAAAIASAELPAAGRDPFADLHKEFEELHRDGGSSNDVAQLLDDTLVKYGYPTVLYR